MSYNRDKAIEYALRHYNGWDTTKYPDFDSQNGDNTDCANFVSQCLYAGGIPMQESNNRYANWYCYSPYNKGDSWAGAQSLRLTLKNGYLNNIKIESLSSPNGLKKGDLIFKLKKDGQTKPRRKAYHVMILIEDYKRDPAVICQRGVRKENRYIYYHLSPEKNDMLFYHITDTANKPTPPPTPTPNPSQAPWEDRYGTVTLKLKSTGEFVSNLQVDLNKLNYNCGNVDGIFGKNTVKAVKAFQKTYKLKQDGEVGNITKRKLWEKIS